MEYINHMVGICVTEKGENVRLDIYCNQGRYMERKTLRYRKEESALCDAALYGLLKRRTGDAPQDCVKGGIEPSPSLKEKSELCRCLSKTYGGKAHRSLLVLQGNAFRQAGAEEAVISPFI